MDDRRQSVRRLLPDTVELSISCRGKKLSGLITNVSKEGMAARFDKGVVLASGDDALGIIDRGEGLSVNMTVVSISQDDLGSTVRFKVKAEKDRQLLWQSLRDGGSVNEGGSTPNQTRVEPIPGKGAYSETERKERLHFLENASSSKLDSITKDPIPAKDVKGNIENYLGSLQVPVGLAGPLLVHGSSGTHVTYAPLATTEGALVASTCRGAGLITDSGGINSAVLRRCMNRIPMFCFENLREAMVFADWIMDHQMEMHGHVSRLSRHASLLSVQTEIHSNRVHVHFDYSTGDAAGQNMTTACTWYVCQWILRQLKNSKLVRVKNFYIDGNLSGDKKVTYRSYVKGRGRQVIAEATLKKEHVERYLNITPQDLLDGYHKALASSVRAGMIGFNINVANVVSAIFLATGQDVACVHESSLAQFDMQMAGEDLYVSMWMPCLIVGTVGGGTGLPGQKELLTTLVGTSEGPTDHLAEIVTSYALALDLSTLAAIVTGEFVDSHEHFGRNRPSQQLFMRKDLTEEFVEDNLIVAKGLAVKQVDIKASFADDIDSIITELSSMCTNKYIGFTEAEITLESEDGNEQRHEIVIKSKPTDTDVSKLATQLGMLIDRNLGDLISRSFSVLDSVECHRRELQLYEFLSEHHPDICPKFFGSYSNDKTETHILLMEKITAVDSASAMDSETFVAVLEKMSTFHAAFLGQEKVIKAAVPSIKTRWQTFLKSQHYWKALNQTLYRKTATFLTDEQIELGNRLLDTYSDWYRPIEEHSVTLIHNDLTPRNIGLVGEAKESPIFYDWELACIHYPQRDLVEFLAFSFALKDSPGMLLQDAIELHRERVTTAAGGEMDSTLWHEALLFSLREFIICRLPYYVMTEHFRGRIDVKRIVDFVYAWHQELEKEQEFVGSSGFS
jgi:hydroxymethylglutaryl-CoA reductase (NADPH)